MFILSLLRTAWLPTLLLLLPNAYAQPAPLGLEQALQAAQARSRQLAAQDTAASAARDMALAAGQLPDPMLKAGINNLPINGPDRFSLTQDFMTERAIGFSQEFTREGKRQARTARYEREAEVAEAGRQAALANLRRDTALAWLERHHQERLRELLRAQRAEAALQIEAAEAAYRGGRGAQADVFAARSAVAQIDDRILQTDRDVATARTRLARWVGGEGADRPLAAPPDLSALRKLEAAGLQAHVAHHPQLALLARQEDVARAEAEIARSNKQADWSVELMYSQRGPAYSNMVSLNFLVPLQIDPANRQDRELAARLAQAEQVRAQRDEALREHLAEARAWLQTWQGNRERLANYDKALIPLAAERTRAALAAYRGGAGPLAAVLDARRMEIDTRAERLRLELETAALWARLEYLIPPEHTAMASAALEQP
ncbi:TolC family protein [Variovorax sp. LARHSF232]